MTLIFPAVIPSSHPVVTWGRFPHVSRRSTGGRSEKIRLSNVNIDAEIQLVFKNIDTEQLLQLRGHWDLSRGTAREFQIHPALLQAMNQASKQRLLATTWKFKDAPRIVDICGGAPGFLLHSLEITLKSEPRRVLSPISQGVPVVPVVAPGARWGVATSWQSGRAGIDQLNLPGATWNVRTNWEPGRASITGGATAPGAEWHVSTSWQPGGSTVPGAVWTATTSWSPGAASSQGVAPGASWNASTSWEPGGASVPPAPRPGAAWSVSTSWAPGGATIIGPAPGASWNVSTSWGPGRAQAVAPGAAWNVYTSWAPGTFQSDPNFTSVELLLNMQGADGSTTFTDSSLNGFTITRYGSPTIQGGAFSGDGDGDFLLSPQSSELIVGTSDFTLEAFAEPTSVNPVNCGLFNLVNATGNQNFASVGVSIFNGNWGIRDGGGYFGRGSATANTRVHVALIRISGVLRLWVDGTQLGATLSNSSDLTNNRIIIGNYDASNNSAAFPGKIGPFRFTRGLGRYTQAFTPPSGTFPSS